MKGIETRKGRDGSAFGGVVLSTTAGVGGGALMTGLVVGGGAFSVGGKYVVGVESGDVGCSRGILMVSSPGRGGCAFRGAWGSEVVWVSADRVRGGWALW